MKTLLKNYRAVIRKFKRSNVYATFKDNIQAADLAEMGLLSSKYQRVKYLLCAIYISTKYAWIKPLKPNKLWIDQEKEFYKSIIKNWLEDNDILMYSTQKY